MITIDENDKRFFIAGSTQPRAGRGLFAATDIKKGEYLEVIGVMVNRESVSDSCTSFADDYKYAADYLDSFKKHIIPMGYAAVINHANNISDQNVEMKYIRKKGEMVCVYSFLRDVKEGEEVLGNYGKEFEEVIDQNASEQEWISFLELGLYNLSKLKRY